MRQLRPLVPVRAALASFALCSALTCWCLYQVLAIDPGTPKHSAQGTAPLVRLASRSGPSSARVTAALRKDPFHAERRRPNVPFRMPGESLTADTAASGTNAGTQLQLIGTAVMPEGRSFAMCQRGADPPRLVRVGERLGGLTLRIVARGRATFVDAGGRSVEVSVPKVGT